MHTTWDSIWYNARIATMVPDTGAYGLLENGAVCISEGRIDWLGPDTELQREHGLEAASLRNCEGRLVTPGLVDCHTHLVYAGNRSQEFEMRLNGASYGQIARAGGGINATVRATRNASEDQLFEQSLPRLRSLQANGVTTVEIKSGYGLDTSTEIKMLRVARRLASDNPVHIKTTFLGAHAVPPEFDGRADDYIDLVCNEMLPRVVDEKLADAVDVFCEGIAFTPAQAERVFLAALEHGLQIKCHAEQLSNLQGAVLAARYGALSVDHLEYLADDDVPAIADAGTVAVLLPGAYFVLRETQLPPLAALRAHGVHLAIATDSNPGSSPVQSMTLMLNMACTLFRLTPEESLAGATREAARALGIENRCGTLEVGKEANLVLWDATEPAELSYSLGNNPCRAVMFQGRAV